MEISGEFTELICDLVGEEGMRECVSLCVYQREIR